MIFAKKRSKCFQKGVASILAGLVFAGTPVFAFSADKTSAESIVFPSVAQEEMQMNSLAEKSGDKLILFDDGQTDFSIVIPETCSESLLDAVKQLQTVCREMTGAELPVIRETQADAARHNICMDTALGTERPRGDIADGYQIIIGDKDISICGADEAGTRNGIYGFIEDILGCMFLTPEDTYIPPQKTVCLAKTDETVRPATQWRDVYAYETAQSKWAAKLRLNGIDVESHDPELSIEQLQYEGWGTWCHNCYQYLSPEEYFDEHPEYFSEKNGKRVTTYAGRDAYLCLSNPEVFEIVKNSLAEKIAENPDQLYWDFSGNDNYAVSGCECKACRAADKAAGGTGMGTLLPFLNKLAQAFPDYYISTLAYLHTLKAPKNIKAEPNVVIKLCSMPGDQAASYLDGANSHAAEFREQVEEWTNIAEHIVVWDYVVDFAHLLMPFPNFAVQAKNQKFYEDHHVIGVFHQASREKGGEFACLRAYVLSRLMWEGSDMDVAKCVSRYVTAYFGNAAPKIIEYMNLCASELCASGNKLGLYDGLMAQYKGYLSEENVSRYQALIRDAKAAAAGNPEWESRVEEVELSVEYARVLLPAISEEERQEALNRINELCGKYEITMVCEWDSLENFNQNSLQSTIKGEQKELQKPYRMGFGIAAGAVTLGVAAGVIGKIVKKKKRTV